MILVLSYLGMGWWMLIVDAAGHGRLLYAGQMLPE
jgi:hypothetical protein